MTPRIDRTSRWASSPLQALDFGRADQQGKPRRVGVLVFGQGEGGSSRVISCRRGLITTPSTCGRQSCRALANPHGANAAIQRRAGGKPEDCASPRSWGRLRRSSSSFKAVGFSLANVTFPATFHPLASSPSAKFDQIAEAAGLGHAPSDHLQEDGGLADRKKNKRLPSSDVV